MHIVTQSPRRLPRVVNEVAHSHGAIEVERAVVATLSSFPEAGRYTVSITEVEDVSGVCVRLFDRNDLTATWMFEDPREDVTLLVRTTLRRLSDTRRSHA
jgi:hypothetical protein